jgi:hypothetical protein
MKRVRDRIFSKCSKTLNQFSREVDVQMGDETYNRIRKELMVEGINHLRNQMYHQMKTHFKQNGSI